MAPRSFPYRPLPIRRRTSLVLAGAVLVALFSFRLWADIPQLLMALQHAKHGRYYPVQLHLHGSMSEGDGSMRGHNAEARELGTVDALWWTDHAWRIAGHGHVPGFDFEGESQVFPVPFRDTPWLRSQVWAGVSWKASADIETEEVNARLTRDRLARAQQALEIAARSDSLTSDWQWAGITVAASGGRLKAPIAADAVVTVWVRPLTSWDEDCRLVVRLVLSRQLDAVAELHYVIGDPGGPRLEAREGRRIGIVPVTAPTGKWTRLVLPVTADVLRFDLGGWDNSLSAVAIGMESRRGAEGRMVVDELRVRRLRSGAEVLARAEEIAASLERELGLVNHVGLEISYADHMNVYLPRAEMPDFEAHPHGMTPEETVAWAHARGGVVSYNHVFGAVDSQIDEYDERVWRLLTHRAFGADLLEVGYPHRVLPLERHLEVWDQLSRDRVLIGGIGTSDSHSQRQGWRGGNNYVTWVWALGPGKEEMIKGLRSRRAFFGDPVLFRGELDLETREGLPMGRAIVTDEPYHDVVLRITHLPPGSAVRWIEQGDLAQEIFDPPAGEFIRTFRVATDSYRFVRAEVWQGSRGLAFSNCLYFFPAAEER